MKKCKECNKIFKFEKHHSHQEFCSKYCREINIKKKIICVDCKSPLNSHAKYAKTFRCRKCNDLFKKGKFPKGGFKLGENKGKNNDNYKHGKYTIDYFCINCGKEISDASAIYGNKRCSKCYGINKIGIELSKEHKQNISLGNIGKKRSDDVKLKYSLSKIGNKNPNYKDGKSTELYTQNFNKLLKKEIKIRDDNNCQNCGMTEDNHKLVYNQGLHVHHIDYNKSNCSKDNLITLCKRCNLKANSNRLYWQKYFLTK